MLSALLRTYTYALGYIHRYADEVLTTSEMRNSLFEEYYRCGLMPAMQELDVHAHTRIHVYDGTL